MLKKGITDFSKEGRSDFLFDVDWRFHFLNLIYTTNCEVISVKFIYTMRD